MTSKAFWGTVFIAAILIVAFAAFAESDNSARTACMKVQSKATCDYALR